MDKKQVDYIIKHTGLKERKVKDILKQLEEIPSFGCDKNIFEEVEFSDFKFTKDHHLVMRYQVAYHIQKAFEAMKVELDDNTIKTPYRIAKVWCGDGLNSDSELGGGRFSNPVRLPVFPNNLDDKEWITKEVRVVATCSHHFLPFTGKAIISYKPNEFVLGISKLQRLTNYIANRFWLQEDLTVELATTIARAAKISPDHVKVKIVAQHSCERDRGVKNLNCDFTTTFNAV